MEEYNFKQFIPLPRGSYRTKGIWKYKLSEVKLVKRKWYQIWKRKKIIMLS